MGFGSLVFSVYVPGQVRKEATSVKFGKYRDVARPHLKIFIFFSPKRISASDSYQKSVYCVFLNHFLLKQLSNTAFFGITYRMYFRIDV